MIGGAALNIARLIGQTKALALHDPLARSTLDGFPTPSGPWGIAMDAFTQLFGDLLAFVYIASTALSFTATSAGCRGPNRWFTSSIGSVIFKSLGPKFSARERKQLNLSRFYAIAQIEYCRNFIFKRNFPIHKLFERSCELGLWRLTADKIADIIGTRLNRNMRGKLTSIIDRIEYGHDVFRAYFKNAFLKQYEKFSTFLRNELVSNNLADFRLKKGLDHLDAVRERFQTITARFAGFQAQWLNVHVDFPLLQRLALPITVGMVRYPGPKMAEILCVCRHVAMLREQGAKGQDSDRGGSLAIVSHDEKPGIQAIGTTAPDRPPLPGISPTVRCDHKYKRHGTLTLMAGIDLLTGHVHALVKERHRSREFIAFLKLLDAGYPADTAIELILDNHSAHLARNHELACRAADRAFYLHVHADPRLVAQSHQGPFLKTGAFGPAPHPRPLRTRNQRTSDGLHCRHQSRARRPHLALQNRRCGMSL